MKPPITPPTSGAAQQVFEILRVDAMAAEASGRIGGVQQGFPLWTHNWTIGNCGPTRTDAWRAFVSLARGGMRRYLAYDLGRPYPKQYLTVGFAGMTRAGGGSFDGTATSWSETINGDDDSQVTLHGLPDGFVMGQGDYIGFQYTATEDGFAGLTWHAMVRVVEAGTADGSGVLDVICEPPIPFAVPGGAVAYLDHPKCVMALDVSKSSLGPIDRSLGMRSGSIVGVQDIRS